MRRINEGERGGEYIPYNTQDYTPHGTKFQADFLRNGKGANAEQRIYMERPGQALDKASLFELYAPVVLEKIGSKVISRVYVIFRAILYSLVFDTIGRFDALTPGVFRTRRCRTRSACLLWYVAAHFEIPHAGCVILFARQSLASFFACAACCSLLPSFDDRVASVSKTIVNPVLLLEGPKRVGKEARRTSACAALSRCLVSTLISSTLSKAGLASSFLVRHA